MYALHSKSSYLVALDNEALFNYRCEPHYRNPALRKLVMTTPFQLSSGHGKPQPYWQGLHTIQEISRERIKEVFFMHFREVIELQLAIHSKYSLNHDLLTPQTLSMIPKFLGA
jgi:hypothetical protein